MELRHLRYFVAVAEHGNISHAARQLFLTQPALSRQVRNLEAELGVALFEHGAKAVRITEAGRVFVHEARAVLQRAEEAMQTVKAVASGQRGEIHVGYAPSLTVELLPRTLRIFQEANPGVRVQLHDLSTEAMLRGLREETLHVALLVQVSGKAMAGLVFEELLRYAGCVAVPLAHPLARARRIGLKDLAAERLIAFTLADYPEYHGWLADAFAGAKRPPQIAEEHDSATSLIAAVEAGRGVAVVHEAFQCFAGPRLKIRALTPPPPPLVVGIACRREANMAATEKFIAAAHCAREK